MKISFIKNLFCPFTFENLNFKAKIVKNDRIIEGVLYSSKKKYLITDGIARFVRTDGYAKSFTYEWKKWNKVQFDSKNINLPMHGYTEKMFKKITDFNFEKLNKKLVLDLGSGPGRFTEIALKYGATVVAIDYSYAIDVLKKNFKSDIDNIIPIQCDATRLPFKNNLFDYSFSIGVLHHTDSPLNCCKEVNRVLKKKGIFALAVYQKNSYYDMLSVKIWRMFFNLFWKIFKHYPAIAYTYFFVNFHWYFLKKIKLISNAFKLFFPVVILPDKNWSYLDTFDSLTPVYASAHTDKEVRKWLISSGFTKIKKTFWGNTSFQGRK
jgi:ubiquinone/menaquinone biosynthesis C-methylase UbiE